MILLTAPVGFYSPVCVKREGSKSWADIEDLRYISRGGVYVQIQDDKIQAMNCKKVTTSAVARRRILSWGRKKTFDTRWL